ncbi:MAG TPA: GAF domain-containing sensor histidine kinase, partial [Gaiellaceae bacterium]|nr:GAF domain-containing sensor histidine kinase [Gaiellaceae bacterium]
MGVEPSFESVEGREEAERLAAVERYAILDTPPDGAFDRVTRLAALIFDVPISTVSIVDRDRIWFKSRHGIDVQEIDREPGLCASAVLQDGPWVVADAEVDPRTLDNPLVRGELGLRFYAGVPLITRDGYHLGTLNVIDREPRQVAAEELSALEDLAGIVVDQLEVRLAARDEAARLARAQADFVTTAAHELRTPLAAVYGAAKLLERTDLTDDTSRSKLLAVIAEESDQLASVVGDILSSAQLEAGVRLHTVREACEPAAIAGRAVDAARSHLPENLSLELADSHVPSIESDAARIKQILASLIDNAVKYSPDGGRIEVSVALHDGGVRFRVHDEGIGVPAAEA